jgi:NhaP-type Na+/H+ or K+/H+ antiporter
MGEFAAYLAVGVLVILSAWIPLFVGRIPLSLPMIAVGLGDLLAVSIEVGDPYGSHSSFMLHLSEFALLVSVFGAGLKIDRVFSWRGWASTWRMLGLVLPLSIAVAAVAGYWLLGLPPALALLLGAILSSTDPVLASDVGAGPPGYGEEGETKFALTSEAGLNDGLAFPFVMLGLLLAGTSRTASSMTDWVLVELIWNLCVGAVVGIGLGWLLVILNELLPRPVRLSASKSGLVSVGLSFIAYGVAMALHCNGFVAVFCEAAAIRNFSKRYEYSQRLNHAAEQFERLAMVSVLVLLGISVVLDKQFTAWGIAEIGFTIFVFVVVRPLAVLIGFIGSAEGQWTRAALSYFGIRGIASIYYVTFAAPLLANDDAQRLTEIVSLVVVASVVLYGTTADIAARYLIGDQKPKDRVAESSLGSD